MESCSKKHKNCVKMLELFENGEIQENEENINNYIKMVLGISYTHNCIKTSENKKKIIDFIMRISETDKIDDEYIGSLLLLLVEPQAIKLYNNQREIDKEMNIFKLVDYYTKYNTIMMLQYHKRGLMKEIFEGLNKKEFMTMMNDEIIYNNMIANIENQKLVASGLKKILKDATEQEIKEVINKFKFSTIILSEIIIKLSEKIKDEELIIEIYNSALKNGDDVLLLKLIVEYDIKVKESDIDIIINSMKNYEHVRYKKCIDIIIEYGIEITKEIIIKLLNIRYMIKKIAKYDIEIDEDIVIKMCEINYYPYEFKIKPTEKILNIECNRRDNIEKIKEMKERGGKYNRNHLLIACSHLKNGKVIKYLIKECKIKPDREIITKFEDTYGIDGLRCLIDNYDNETNKNIEIEEEPVELNSELLIDIEPNKKIFEENKEYEIKVSIKKFFKLKKNEYSLVEMKKILLDYLIKNNLVISKYFVINRELENLIKIQFSKIINIDNISNIITHFFI